MEVALRLADAKSRHRWVRQPSRELGIDGFDDLWLSPDEVPIAEYVPRDRVQALRVALVERARRQSGQAVERDAVLDRRPVIGEVDVDAIDISPPVAGVGREPGLV